jgi:GAF domain-containing protein
MGTHINDEALRSSLQRLRRASVEGDPATVMRRAVDAVHDVFGYSGAGIMFITESGRLASVASSDESGRQLEEAQATTGQGPCYESYVYSREVVSSDLHGDRRWPALRGHLTPPLRAVAGVPILLGGSPVGTLNVYRDEPVEWDDSDIRALRAYSDLVAEILGAALAADRQGTLARQLQYALDYRVIIERAVGYLMGAHKLDAVTAFDILRKRARDSRRRVADVATEVLGGTTGPDGLDPAGRQHTANGTAIEPRRQRADREPVIPPGG